MTEAKYINPYTDFDDRDITNAINTAKRDEAKKIAAKMKAAGIDAATIAQVTGLKGSEI